jgi:membrane-bound ClpP family serine protease
MIIVGLVLLLIGWLTAIHLLAVIGIVLLIVGAVLLLAGATGNAVGGRRHYW